MCVSCRVVPLSINEILSMKLGFLFFRGGGGREREIMDPNEDSPELFYWYAAGVSHNDDADAQQLCRRIQTSFWSVSASSPSSFSPLPSSSSSSSYILSLFSPLLCVEIVATMARGFSPMVEQVLRRAQAMKQPRKPTVVLATAQAQAFVSAAASSPRASSHSPGDGVSAACVACLS